MIRKNLIKATVITTIIATILAASGCGKKAANNDETTMQAVTVSAETASNAAKELTKTGLVTFEYTDPDGNTYTLEGKAVASETGEAVIEVTDAEGNKVTVKGAKGTLERVLPAEMTIKVEDGHVVVTRPNDLKKMKSLHGLTRTLISNMVTGVHTGYEKVLEVNGVGYRCSKSGNKLTLNLGYSHPVEMTDPEGLEAVVDGNKITVKGIDKEKVGQYAAEIRDKRRPEPYKGKGIKYETEVIRRKVGKTGKK